MLIREDSPLRRLPLNLNPEKAQFRDGLRFMADMVAMAYQELVIHLLALSGPGPEVKGFVERMVKDPF
jgi:hypothetical protein